MECAACGRSIAEGDRFCNGCGRPVEPDVLPRTELVEHVLPDNGWELDDPVWAPTGAVAVVGAEPTPVPQTTAVLPVTPPTAELPAFESVAPHRAAVRLTPTAALGIIGGLVLMVSMFATVVEVVADIPLTVPPDAPVGFRLGTWIAGDFGSNLPIAGLVAALTMTLGGVAAMFGHRWGAGLVGGGGLAASGLAALSVGFAQIPLDAAQDFAAIPSDVAFTLTITKALGYWLLVTAGAVGIVAFFASTNDAFGERLGGLNPWTAALGALAVSVAAVGPLLPKSTAVFSDNWFVIDRPGESPAMLVAMRLVQLGLLAIGGTVGFLSVRRWGLGVAAGAVLPSLWLGVSTLFVLGEAPIGPGFRNPGTADVALHGVTVIGLASTVAMFVLAIIAASEQARRR